MMRKKSGSKSILDMSNLEARKFFLKNESYFNLDLPSYYDFSNILVTVNKIINGKDINSMITKGKVRELNDVNFPIFANKDGRYSWRPFQLIHPLLYTSLVRKITMKSNWQVIIDRLNTIRKHKKIIALGLPVESLSPLKDKASQVSYWWTNVEQKSLTLALDYSRIIHTDITDCYSSIYTHSIVWAIHTKDIAKKKRNDSTLIGNHIDWHIQDMRSGQTNGIPQGSVLMDFIAEIVLHYCDDLLAEKLKKEKVTDYKILRYRDDYRIFVNSSLDGEKILKSLTEILLEHNLKLNPSKTILSDDVIGSSLKPDKLTWLAKRQSDENIQKHLLLIYKHSLDFPNSGSLSKALTDFFKTFESSKGYNSAVLASIVVEIALKNPRTYPICAAILSQIINKSTSTRFKSNLLKKVNKKFERIPNTEYMQIWLHRIKLSGNSKEDSSYPLCRATTGKKVVIWNNDWITNKALKNELSKNSFIKKGVIKSLSKAIDLSEVELFSSEEKSL